MISLFIGVQLLILPVLGLVWLGIRSERATQERLLKQAVKALIVRSTVK